MLRDAVPRYCLTFHCYKGPKPETDSDKRKFWLGCDVVVNLLKESNCLNKGYHVLFDKFFSGVDFVRYLYFTESYLRGYSSVQIRKIQNYFFIFPMLRHSRICPEKDFSKYQLFHELQLFL